MQRYKGSVAGLLMCLSIFLPSTTSAVTLKNTEDDVILAVHQAVRDNQLSMLHDHCLTYDYDEASNKNYFIVNVREDKRYVICGGDPHTSVHLFTFKVNRKDYSLMTDANSKDGSFYPIIK